MKELADSGREAPRPALVGEFNLADPARLTDEPWYVHGLAKLRIHVREQEEVRIGCRGETRHRSRRQVGVDRA